MNTYKTETQLINILNFLDSLKLYRRLLVNPKAGGSRKLVWSRNDFKTSSAKLLMPTDPTKMSFDAYRPKKNVGLNILLFRVQIKSHMIHFQI